MTTYSNFPILYDESIYEESNPVRKHLENIGLTVLSINGIEAVLEEIENKAGVTKEIKNGNNVTWNRWQR